MKIFIVVFSFCCLFIAAYAQNQLGAPKLPSLNVSPFKLNNAPTNFPNVLTAPKFNADRFPNMNTPAPLFKPSPPQQFGQLTGGGAFDRKWNGGLNVKYQHPSGASGALGYGHLRGYGHDVSADAKVPVWRSNDRSTTINASGGLKRHFGGPEGARTLDKRVGVDLVYRF